MGESVTEGTILHWLVKEGDRVQKDQLIVEISTDKVDTEVPSPTSGILRKIIHKEDKTVPVGTAIATLEEAEVEEAPFATKEEVAPAEEKKIEKKVTAVPPRPDKLQFERKISPLVKRMAKEHRIDLSKVRGTGIGGRVTKQDILIYIKIKPEYAPPALEEEVKEKEEIVPVNPKRKIIAKRMSESKRTAAHVTTTFEVDMTKIVKFREEQKEAFLKNEKVKLTYLPFVILNTARALKRYPIFNSSWSDEGIIMKKDINIGIAVSLEDGLIVPVIKNADKKNLVELAKVSQDLAQRVRNKRLNPDEVQDGTFTITNYGSNGSLFGTPIILLPQIAILGTGAIVKKPIVINDAIAIRSMMYLSLSFDHRVVDGAQADKFLITIKESLEGWEQEVYEQMPSTETEFGGVW
ncbi:MAG: 2-oxoglutarate dehydrogenase complex E2 component [Candidatus Scalindua rubra]|uniref:Dihydrolipoamide acetyltransferase component of pyruvate dehydrogenase complex n=1 Tax=Candidatus Scalindua rubra TaxID=1872076 RepID=A0A1E3X7Y0_9BACT|nr:MAG: 2-oxoglutarate dehydrogenase complex E2 component [Candidatus Scalindua rubra]